MYSTPKALCRQELTEFVGHKDEVNCISFSSDFSFMVTGCDDHRVRVFNVKTKQCVARLKGHEGAVKSVAVSPCDQYFVSGSFDKTARIWKTSDESCLHVLTGHTKGVEVVAFSSCSVYLCTGSWDRKAILWCVQTGCQIRTFSGHGSLVQSVAFSRTHQLLASGSWDFTIRVWTLDHIKNMKIIDTYVKLQKASKDIEVAETKILETETENNGMNIEIIKYEKGERGIINDNGEKHNVHKSKEDQKYEIKNGNGNDSHKDKGQKSKEGKGNDTENDEENNAQNNKVDDSNTDNDIKSNRVIDNQNHKGNESSELYIQKEKENCQEKTSVNGSPFVEDADNFKVLAGHTGNVHAVAFSNLGMLASGSWDRSVRIWNPMNGRCLRILLGHTGWVQAVSFSPDASYCASAADDDSVKVWDIVTGECINTLQGSTYLAHHCAFTEDGHLIASGAALPPFEGLHKKVDDKRPQFNNYL